MSIRNAVIRALTGLAFASLVVPGLAAAAASRDDLQRFNAPHEPFKIFGNTYYVGTEGLSSILITSDFGHVLIDGGLPESAPQIAANIEKLGFKIGDVKAILQSHAHPDHVGGIAELQKLSGGASVYARRPADEVMRTGKLPAVDPQFATKGSKIPTVQTVWIIREDQLLGVGSNRLRALGTPGHTSAGTSWSWESCEGKDCLQMVYADSLSPVSAGKYRFSDHPEVLAQFEQSFKTLESVKCDVVLSPHPEVTDVFGRASKAAGKAEALKDPEGCKKYVAGFRDKLQQRLAEEGSSSKR